MNTRILQATPEAISTAAQLLRDGEVVAFPTETVYGLGADALNPSAIEKVFIAKNRPSDNPLIVHVAEPADVYAITENISATARQLLREFWPGPLSLVLHKSASIPHAVTAGLDTVVVRCPEHPVARALIAEARTPIAAPSANLSGHVSPTSAEHVADDLRGRIPLILDGGVCRVGLESTVIDCTNTPPVLLRPGTITQEAIEAVVGSIQKNTKPKTISSPGMKYRHYAPHTPVQLFATATELYEILHTIQLPVIVLHHSPLTLPNDVPQIHLSSNPAEAAQQIYHALRTADTLQTERILIESYPESEVGTALMNRLQKAAQG